MDEKSFGKRLDIAAQVVNGSCPVCAEESIFVSIHKTIYRNKERKYEI